MVTQQDCRLYAGTELPALLRLTQGQVDWLIQTGQLRTIRICGEVRVTSHELDALVETYAQIAKRKQHAEVIQ